LIDSSIAEGREKPKDGSRPLSSARQLRVAEKAGSIRHIVRTGLPPGIEPAEAADPGSQRKGPPAKNSS
jgi:hypothetical protein